MNTYTFTNAHGDSIELNGWTEPIRLHSIEGLNGITGSHITIKCYGADGAGYKRTDLDPRQITIKLYIEGIGDERNESRDILTEVFNPKIGAGVLTCNIDGRISTIAAVPDGLPDQSMLATYVNDPIAFILLAHDPYYLREKENIDFSYDAGGLHFPLAVEANGVDVGYRVVQYVKIVDNEGAIETGCKATLAAIGAVTNPVIKCLETDSQLKINYSMSAGEKLVIDTNKNVHRIKSIKSGTETDITAKMDFTTSFFDIPSGKSTFVYDADSGKENLNLSVEFTPKYLSV